jgi:hypothetical protein
LLWNTAYADAALERLRAIDQEVHDDDVVRLSPLGFNHINFLGRYSFTAPPAGSLRRLRNPRETDDEAD